MNWGDIMAKYESWILRERKLLPLGNRRLCNEDGLFQRVIRNIYECPYCHKEIYSNFTNKCNSRKCRFCNHPVSPYKGDTTEQIWLPEDVDTLP